MSLDGNLEAKRGLSGRRERKARKATGKKNGMHRRENVRLSIGSRPSPAVKLLVRALDLFFSISLSVDPGQGKKNRRGTIFAGLIRAILADA